MKKLSLVILIMAVLLLGGCNLVEGINSNNESEENSASEDNNDNQSNPDDKYVPVQEYTGEGYTLANGKETDRIANENRDVVEDAVKQFFQEEYKTEVKVHQIVGNVDGATVFVESVGEPHFYTYAIVPIDKANESIRTDKVWSQEGQVEGAIIAGIYGMIMKEEFQHLNNLIEEINSKYNLTGLNERAIAIGANQYSTQYYFMNILPNGYFKFVYDKYIKNPDRNVEEWAEIIDVDKIDPEEINVAINLYMAEKGQEPDQKAFQELVKKVEEDDDIPKGNYGVFLHDNKIDKKSATGHKDNSLTRSYPDDIIKE
ncbi:DUF1672 family protein [Paraliobacillus ryukyuensis]|uniref:DUF1672 family protein n=1 Tax=Paraliobacillus ryukyuensis TaxID=200904 RepID=UPI0009A70F8C|nr:DUF1672 family protein [Paraliobacillus ryukyuensis]